ncbi:unnamed protein product [Acanthoscelides obtectus]|uniref:Uncharacterized protein n=1 Tax=Acanthoscelides obtectus TaxID=200917 RepID=A0A9P0LBG6_ACAOB|nr:unnamed protein product [Acanthoscelides obtectus]CAK1669784.1 hypothetical protein AOBTE_LOCUS27246 [Acanthoscelides obtectus]
MFALAVDYRAHLSYVSDSKAQKEALSKQRKFTDQRNKFPVHLEIQFLIFLEYAYSVKYTEWYGHSAVKPVPAYICRYTHELTILSINKCVFLLDVVLNQCYLEFLILNKMMATPLPEGGCASSGCK